MAISQSQKVDFLLKKIGYTKTKTGLSVDGSLTGTKKAGFAEAIPSPLIIADGSLWTESDLIPTTPPGSDTTQVKVYLAGASGLRLTVDSTVASNRAFIAYTTYNNTSSARLTNWIDTQFGDDYLIKVYKGDPNSGGVALSASGSGSNDGWFFDYSAGVLNFNDTNVPSGVTSSNIYIVGYRYIGNTGAPSPGDDFTYRDLTVTRNLSVGGLSTFTGLVDINGGGQATTFKVEDLTDNRIVIAGTGGELEDSANLTFNGTVLALTGNQTVSGTIDVDGQAIFDDITVSAASTFTGISTFNSNIFVEATTDTNQLNVSGVSTYAGLVDINGGGQANTFKVEDLTSGRVTYAGSGGELQDSANLTFDGTDLTAASAKISDLTDNRVVIAGSSGALEDSANLTFDGTTLAVTGNATVSGNVDLGDATSDTITATGRFDSYLVPSADSTYDLGTSALNWRKIYADEIDLPGGPIGQDIVTRNLKATGITTLATAQVSDLTSGRVVLAGTAGEIEDSGNLTFNGSTLAVTGSQTVSGDIDVVGNVSIGGTLTYQDVTNVDSVGIATARTGIHILAGGLLVNAGVATFTQAIDANGGADISGVSTIANLQIGNTNNIDIIRDEDNMASDDVNALATQQSIKAYVDSNVTAQDLDFVGDTGSGQVDLDSQTFQVTGTPNEIVTTAAGRILNVGLSDDVVVGASLTVTTALRIGASGTIGITTILDEDNMASNRADALATQQSIKAYVDNSSPGGSALAVSADSGSNESINLSSEVLDIEGTSNEIVTVTGTNKVVIGLPDDVTVGRDLTVTRNVTVGAGLTVVGVSTFAGNIDANANLDVDGQTDLDVLNVSDTATFAAGLVANGNVDLGNATSDTITATGRFDSDLVPSADSARDLGTSALNWRKIYVDEIDLPGGPVGQDIVTRNLKATGISTFEGDTNIGAGGATLFADVSATRVGINSTAPAYTLDVGGVINSSTDIRINGVSVGGGISADDATALAIALG